jgi:hypothetical protein
MANTAQEALVKVAEKVAQDECETVLRIVGKGHPPIAHRILGMGRSYLTLRESLSDESIASGMTAGCRQRNDLEDGGSEPAQVPGF